jgi:hypothetical protein
MTFMEAVVGAADSVTNPGTKYLYISRRGKPRDTGLPILMLRKSQPKLRPINNFTVADLLADDWYYYVPKP